MKMDLNAIIEKMETGDQDAALTALQMYNKEVHHINVTSIFWDELLIFFY